MKLRRPPAKGGGKAYQIDDITSTACDLFGRRHRVAYGGGTLSGNPLAMTAGIETLKKLSADGMDEELERKSKKLIDGIVAAATKHGLPISGDFAGGMFGWYFVEGPVKNFSQAAKSDSARFGKWR
jgi:glutamate-1-semialdehyde 2,1-aminomutase